MTSIAQDGADPVAEGPAPVFPVLDALRFVGALAVLTTHVTFWSGDYTRHGAAGTLLARLDVGVALFFVLSGFLLSRPWLASAAARRPRPRAGRYLWKRLLRIAPVYVVAVVAALSLIEDNADLGARDWLVTLTMTGTFLDPLLPAGLSQMWSLAVEVSFYLVLPLLMLVATGRRALRPVRVVAVLVLLVAATVVWHLWGAPEVGQHVDGSPLQWLPAYTSWFAVGIGLALAHVVAQGPARPTASALARRVADAVLGLARQPGACWSLAAALLLVSATPLAGPALLAAPTPSESLTKNLLYAAVGGLVVLTGLRTDGEGRFAQVLSSRPARHLGFTSYSLFCLHLPVLHLVMHVTGWQLFGGHGVQLWLATLATSLVAAELGYRLVERPALRLKDARVPGRGPAGPTSPSSVSRPTSGTSAR